MSLIDDIKRHEGFSPVTYICPNGYETIGYGQRTKYLTCTKAQAEEWLIKEINDLQKRITSAFEWWFNSPEEVKDIVVELCYQMGLSGFSKFKKTIYLLETEQYEEASLEMLDSHWGRHQARNRAHELSERLANVKRQPC